MSDCYDPTSNLVKQIKRREAKNLRTDNDLDATCENKIIGQHVEITCPSNNDIPILKQEKRSNNRSIPLSEQAPDGKLLILHMIIFVVTFLYHID